MLSLLLIHLIGHRPGELEVERHALILPLRHQPLEFPHALQVLTQELEQSLRQVHDDAGGRGERLDAIGRKRLAKRSAGVIRSGSLVKGEGQHNVLLPALDGDLCEVKILL